MRRLLVFLIIVCLAGFGSVAVGAWTLPAGQAGTTLDSAGAADPPTVAPQVAEPRLAPPKVSTAPTVAVAEPLTVIEILPPVPPVSADHLTPVVREEHAPEAIVTTTTAPPTTTAAAPAPAPVVTVAFTATQAYGSCGEDVPYDIFSGTASPGSTVAISSPFGSGSATADGSGHWERRVEFASAPRGETFAVGIHGLGGSATLHFTATGGDHG